MESNDPRPPPGKWLGYYLYHLAVVQHRQTIRLYFSNYAIVGNGTDDVGNFTIKGSYDPELREARWQKCYVTHDVLYRGFYEDSSIWGIWRIDDRASGGFRIWHSSYLKFVSMEEAKKWLVNDRTALRG